MNPNQPQFEIETKILDIDPKKMQQELRNLGFVEYYNGRVHAVYFDTPDWQLRDNGRSLRVRHQLETGVVKKTEKLKRKKYIPELGDHDWAKKIRVCEEIEVVLCPNEGERADQLFCRMRQFFIESGHQEHQEIEKDRISLRNGGVRIEIDTLLRHNGGNINIRPYLEIEADSYALLVECAVKLGFNKEDAHPWSTRKLLRKKRAGEIK